MRAEACFVHFTWHKVGTPGNIHWMKKGREDHAYDMNPLKGFLNDIPHSLVFLV